MSKSCHKVHDSRQRHLNLQWADTSFVGHSCRLRSAIVCHQELYIMIKASTSVVHCSVLIYTSSFITHWYRSARVFQGGQRKSVGKMWNSTPAAIPKFAKNPEPLVTKICMGDYVFGDLYPCKISLQFVHAFLPPPPRAIVRTKCLATFFWRGRGSSIALAPSSLRQFLRCIIGTQNIKAQNDWRRFAQRCDFWGSRKPNVTFWPYFSRKKLIFWSSFFAGINFASQRP